MTGSYLSLTQCGILLTVTLIAHRDFSGYSGTTPSKSMARFINEQFANPHYHLEDSVQLSGNQNNIQGCWFRYAQKFREESRGLYSPWDSVFHLNFHRKESLKSLACVSCLLQGVLHSIAELSTMRHYLSHDKLFRWIRDSNIFLPQPTRIISK